MAVTWAPDHSATALLAHWMVTISMRKPAKSTVPAANALTNNGAYLYVTSTPEIMVSQACFDGPGASPGAVFLAEDNLAVDGRSYSGLSSA